MNMDDRLARGAPALPLSGTARTAQALQGAMDGAEWGAPRYRVSICASIAAIRVGPARAWLTRRRLITGISNTWRKSSRQPCATTGCAVHESCFTTAWYSCTELEEMLEERAKCCRH